MQLANFHEQRKLISLILQHFIFSAKEAFKNLPSKKVAETLLISKSPPKKLYLHIATVNFSTLTAKPKSKNLGRGTSKEG